MRELFLNLMVKKTAGSSSKVRFESAMTKFESIQYRWAKIEDELKNINKKNSAKKLVRSSVHQSLYKGLIQLQLTLRIHIHQVKFRQI